METKGLFSSFVFAVAALIPPQIHGQPASPPAASYPQADFVAETADEALDDMFATPDRQRLDELLVQVETMSRRVPEHARLYVIAARAHIRRDCSGGRNGCSERAKELLLKALQLNPRLVEAHATLAMHAMNGGCMACARPYLDNAQRLDRDHPDYLHALGRYNTNIGRDKEAAANLIAAINAHTKPKKKAIVYKLLADVYAWEYKIEPAEQALRNGLAANAGPLSYGSLGQFLVCVKGDHEAAVPVLEKALSLLDYGFAQRYLGLAHYEKWGEAYLKQPRAASTAEALKVAQSLYPDVQGIFLESLRCFGASRAAHAMLRSGMVPKDVLNHPIAEGFTPLAVAAKHGKTQFVKYMLSQGADPNARSKDGWTALMQAAHRGHDEIVAALLARKADPNVLHAKGSSIPLLLLASGVSDEDTLKILTRLADAKVNLAYAPHGHSNPLYLAVIHRKAKTVRFLLSKGAPVPAGPPGHQFDLMNAAIFFGGAPVVQALIEGGIPLDPAGLQTPYDQFAESMGKKDIAEQIRRARPVKG